MRRIAPLASVFALSTLFACSARLGAPTGDGSLDSPRALDLSIARAPYQSVEVNWKHRLDQPYVYVEARGSYTQVGRALETLFTALKEQSVDVSGPPFALYFDDPGRVPTSELRLRACIPVAAPTAPRAPLAYDVLPSTTVAYAYVAGPYPEAPRAYPAIYAYLSRMNWVESGPVREIYLRNPADVKDWDELVCEIQIPAGLSR